MFCLSERLIFNHASLTMNSMISPMMHSFDNYTRQFTNFDNFDNVKLRPCLNVLCFLSLAVESFWFQRRTCLTNRLEVFLPYHQSLGFMHSYHILDGVIFVISSEFVNNAILIKMNMFCSHHNQ